MARHGIPEEVVSDNIPYSAREFTSFAETYGFKHKTISPGHSQSNGKVESAVKIAKRLIKKSTRAGTDLYHSLLQIRNTPTEGMNSSPAQRLLNRRTRNQLPVTKPMLKPKVQTNVNARKAKKVKKQIRNYNKSAKDLRDLNKGESVRVESIRKWQKGTIMQNAGIRSYEVSLD
jgi:hypothetical protein